MRNPNLGSSLTHIDRLMTFSDVHCKTRDASSSFPHNIQSRILSIHPLPHSITQNVGKENAFIMNYVHSPKAQASSSLDAPQNRQLLPSFSSSHPSAETTWSDTKHSGIIIVPLIQAPPSQRCLLSTTLFSSSSNPSSLPRSCCPKNQPPDFLHAVSSSYIVYKVQFVDKGYEINLQHYLTSSFAPFKST